MGGEPGVGKSRLLAETAATWSATAPACSPEAAPRTSRTPTSRSWSRSPRCAPALADGSLALRGVVATVRDRSSAILDTVAGEGPEGRRATAATVRRRSTPSVETLGGRAAQPLVLVLEDVHWASESALDLLSYVVERTPAAALLVLASQRTTSPDRSASLVDHVSRLYRLDGVRRIDLAPLDADEIAEYLVHEGRVPDDRASEGAARLRDRTGGNPFFLRELVRDLRAGRDDVLQPDGPAPQSVQDTIESRVRTLGADGPRHAGARRRHR